MGYQSYIRALTTLAVCAGSLCAQGDTNCPALQPSVRLQYAQSLARQALRNSPIRIRPMASEARALNYDGSQDVNFIDTRLFTRMQSDGVAPAGPATDAEYLRRVTLDITGHIPTAPQVLDYTGISDPNKQAALLDRLLGSNEYVDYWTLWFNNTYQVTSQYYNFIGVPGRTQFNGFLRSFLTTNGSFQDFAAAIITASGDSHRNGAANYIMRGQQYSQPVQDSWDEITNRVTTHFLGVQTTCISCHNGRGHLEQINLYLSKKNRLDFWKQSAFFSRMNILRQSTSSTAAELKGIITDLSSGGYNSVLADPDNRGPRPARTGGPYTPAYLFTGETPQTGHWRQELARLVVKDRQFARAFVNYLWAHFFRVGIVDPPNAFDLARLDPANPPADGILQPTNPELLEQLTDQFIAGGYQIKPMIRLMAESRAYHLSSVYNAPWSAIAALDYAKSIPRRLSAEELYDAVITATATPVAMNVEGIPQTLYYAGQLPDPAEPRSEALARLDSYNYIRDFLSAFGRGDWNLVDRDNSSNPVLALHFMNSNTVTPRTFGNTLFFGNSLVAQLTASTPGNEAAVTAIALSTLGRPPSAQEMALALAYPWPTPSREQWLSDILWVFINETEFFFNH